QHSESTAEICEQQRPHHRSNRGTRLKRVSRCSEKAWLSRSAEAAHCKSKSTMRLIACANPSSPRPIVFWCPVGSVRWVNTYRSSRLRLAAVYARVSSEQLS